MGEPKKQICSIRIMFPAESDEQAIEYKKKITELLSEIPESNIQFGLMTDPSRNPTNARI